VHKPQNLKPLSKKMVTRSQIESVRKDRKFQKFSEERIAKRDMRQRGNGSKEMLERKGENAVRRKPEQRRVYKEVEAGEVALALGVAQWRSNDRLKD
jgi:hypothetical protein